MVGGGPSLRPRVLPRLRGEMWIACNATYVAAKALGVVAPVVLAMDKRVKDDAQWDRRWDPSPGTVLVNHDVGGPPAGRHWPGWMRLGATPEWSTSLEAGLWGASNAGAAALNLADLLGADPIYLLGIDLRCDDPAGLCQHWHGEYPAEWVQRQAAYRKMVEDFETAAQHVRAQVINLNPESAVECFTKGAPPWALS